MNSKKCHICKGPTAKYLWGFPDFSDDLETKINSEEIVLGGCCIVHPSPKWHCGNCSIDYYPQGFGLYVEEEVHERPNVFTELEIDDFIKFNSPRKMKFLLTVGGHVSPDNRWYAYFDGILAFRTNESMHRIIPENKSTFMILSKRQKSIIEAFIKGSKWESNYDNYNVLDGIQWKLEIRINKDYQQSIYGSNVFPDNYNKLMGILDDICGDVI